jgi:hypothetical protein
MTIQPSLNKTCKFDRVWPGSATCGAIFLLDNLSSSFFSRQSTKNVRAFPASGGEGIMHLVTAWSQPVTFVYTWMA